MEKQHTQCLVDGGFGRVKKLYRKCVFHSLELWTTFWLVGLIAVFISTFILVETAEDSDWLCLLGLQYIAWNCLHVAGPTVTVCRSL